MSKRIMAALAAAGVVALGIAAPMQARAADSGRVTVIWSPHPDDETLRLAAYTQIATRRGDVVVLEAVTDGGASDVCKQLFATRQECEDARALEQQNAWHADTWFATPTRIERLELPDGAVRSADVQVKATAVTNYWRGLGYDVEHYVAASTRDVHPDHVATARGVYAGAAGAVVRDSLSPDATSGGWQYQPQDLAAAVDADEAYRQIGWRSTPALFKALRVNCPNNGYCSRIVMGGQ